jgi:hypothetical protein
VDFGKWVLLVKTVLDLGCSWWFAAELKWPMAVMFFGFAIADFGALCLT